MNVRNLPFVAAQQPQNHAIEAPALIDGREKKIILSDIQARRRADLWERSKTGITFSFSADNSGYLIEAGNHTNFTKAQPVGFVDVARCKTLTIGLTFTKHDFTAASVALFCFMCDGNGKILAKQRIACDGGKGIDHVIVPQGAQKMCVALRLARTGSFSGLSFTVERQKARAANQNKALSAPQTDIAMAIMDRNYNKAIALTQALEMRTEYDRVQLMKCHSALHRFDCVIEEFEKLWPDTQQGIVPRTHYLRALANLGEIERAQKLIAACALNLSGSKADIDFMVAAYPFAAFISDTLAQLVRGRIMASAAHLKKSHLHPLLRCAHDLVSENRFEEFYRLAHIITALDLPREDRAKLHILSAHGYFMLGRHDLKLDCLNKALAVFGACPIAVKKPEKPIDFRSITCPGSVPGSARGPLVSVIMTTYNSAKTIIYALNSLVNQTYLDLEILVIDDCSHDATCKKIEAVARRDHRVTLIRTPRNSGTYVAKNHGLRMAKGAYVTCHDSDDWAHPQKIERSIAALLADPALIATAVRHVRYDPKRGFRGRNGYIQLDAPSLMYRKKEVLERIGYYDSVRAGADTEHQHRIERAFGRKAVKFLPDFLNLFLWSETSLTGGGIFAIDDDAGIFSKPRSLYRKAHVSWQEETQNLFIDFPLDSRPFEIPAEMEP